MNFTCTVSKVYNNSCTSIYNNVDIKARQILIYFLSKIIHMFLFTMRVVTCAPTSKFEVFYAEGPSSCVASCCVLRRKVFHAEYLTTHIAVNGTLMNFKSEYDKILLTIISILYS
jgi:hypothetical protein